MGLIASVFENARLGNCSNGGLSAHFTQVCVINASGPFEPSADTPAVQLIAHPAGEAYGVIAVPADFESAPSFAENRGRSMFGGAYISTSDSRFGELIRQIAPMTGPTGIPIHSSGPVALHDRFEDPLHPDA